MVKREPRFPVGHPRVPDIGREVDAVGRVEVARLSSGLYDSLRLSSEPEVVGEAGNEFPTMAADAAL